MYEVCSHVDGASPQDLAYAILFCCNLSELLRSAADYGGEGGDLPWPPTAVEATP